MTSNIDTITFEKWITMWREIYKKPFVQENTLRLTYDIPINKYLKPHFGTKKLTEIKPIHVQHFFTLHLHLSQSVLDKLHMILYSSFCAAIDNDYCEKNPVSFIRYKSNRSKNLKQVYTVDEIDLVKKFAYHNIPEVFFILETGLRRGEICGLKWDDIDFERKSVSVSRSIADQYGGGVKVMPPKWNSYRELPLSPSAITFLEEKYIINKERGFVFPNNKGSVQSPSALSQRLKRQMKYMAKNLNCKALTAHELRHTFGTDLRRSGKDIYTIQRMMGHKDINVTSEIYVHNEFDELKKVMGY